MMPEPSQCLQSGYLCPAPLTQPTPPQASQRHWSSGSISGAGTSATATAWSAGQGRPATAATAAAITFPRKVLRSISGPYVRFGRSFRPKALVFFHAVIQTGPLRKFAAFPLGGRARNAVAINERRPAAFANCRLWYRHPAGKRGVRDWIAHHVSLLRARRLTLGFGSSAYRSILM